MFNWPSGLLPDREGRECAGTLTRQITGAIVKLQISVVVSGGQAGVSSLKNTGSSKKYAGVILRAQWESTKMKARLAST